MSDPSHPPIALRAADVPARTTASNYPEPYASRMGGRTKRALGDAFGLASFGANLTTLEPGAMSALKHVHSVADELVYVLEGTPTLVTDAGERDLAPGDCAGFPANGVAHHLVNRSDAPVTYLERSAIVRRTTRRATPTTISPSGASTGAGRSRRKDGGAVPVTRRRRSRPPRRPGPRTATRTTRGSSRRWARR